MNKPLAYLQEILTSYGEDREMANSIILKMHEKRYENTVSFINELSDEQIQFLNHSLPDEMKHALESEDFPRLQQLNEVYELL